MKRTFLAFAIAAAIIGCSKPDENSSSSSSSSSSSGSTPTPTPTVKSTTIQLRMYATADLINYSDVKILSGSDEVAYTVEKPDWNAKDSTMYRALKTSVGAQQAAKTDPDMGFKVLVSKSPITVKSDAESSFKATYTRNSTALPLNTKLNVGCAMYYLPLESGVKPKDFVSTKLRAVYAYGIDMGADTATAESRYEKVVSPAFNYMTMSIKYGSD